MVEQNADIVIVGTALFFQADAVGCVEVVHAVFHLALLRQFFM